LSLLGAVATNVGLGGLKELRGVSSSLDLYANGAVGRWELGQGHLCILSPGDGILAKERGGGWAALLRRRGRSPAYDDLAARCVFLYIVDVD
jgi:hypothetical protein